MIADDVLLNNAGLDSGITRTRDVVTPEGTALKFRLASRIARGVALGIDTAVIAVVGLVVYALTTLGASNLAQVLLGLFLFVFRVCYFPATELAWNGRTIGKRVVGLRVIDRQGGPLRREAVIVRNFVREVELWLPLLLLFELVQDAGSPAFILVTAAWVAGLLAIPFLNRDRMRGGDIVAGTWVVEDVKPLHIPDLLLRAERPGRAFKRDEQGGDGIRFNRQQLVVYGVLELELLADVLRNEDASNSALRASVAERIQKKIAWESATSVDTDAFLLAYYTALRGHLERQGLTKGRRPADKRAAESALQDSNGRAD